MSTVPIPENSLVLNEEERTTLIEILEEVLRETRVELHRTDAFAAREVVGARLAKIESLLAKAKELQLV